MKRELGSENVRKVCTSCAEKRRLEMQEVIDYMIGNYHIVHVKVRFDTGSHNENMWVDIEDKGFINLKTRTMTGILDNDPTEANLKIGDEVTFPFTDILDVGYREKESGDRDNIIKA